MRFVRSTLLSVALMAPWPAAAQSGRIEACDASPGPGVEATAAAIVRTACQEHRLWWRPFIDADGRLAELGVTEAERTRLFDDATPAWKQVVRYWRESGTLSAMVAGGTPGAASCMYPGTSREIDNDCRAFLVDNPWSAAFISWVLVRASLYGFATSPRHMDYIVRAWRHPESSPYLYADPFIGKPAPGDLLCYLRSNDRELGPGGLREALSGQGPMPSRSHCEIVVAANVYGDNTLHLIGGNVLNTVMMRKLPLDRSGRLLPDAVGTVVNIPVKAPPAAPAQTASTGKRTPPTAVASRNGSDEAAGAEDSTLPIDSSACRPGFPAACSFNRRDWVVLLKLKPQAQLGGWVPRSPAASPSPGTTTPAPTH